MTDREELVKLAAELGAMSMRLSYEQDRVTVIAACELFRRLASSDGGVKSEPEPVAWRDIIKRPDERPLPTYGQIPWAQLGRDVNDATFGRRADFEFSDKVYPGHQMVLGINFNSLARIVDKYRYYGLPCVADTVPAHPADAGMREAVQQAIDEASYLASIHAHHALWHGLLPYGWDAATEQFGRNLAGAIAKAIKTELPKRLPALTAPGATTKSDADALDECAASGRSCIYAGDGPNGEFQCIYCGKLEPSGYIDDVERSFDETPLADSLKPSDPSPTRSEVTFESLADWLNKRGSLIAKAALSNPGRHSTIDLARALLDQFEIRRK
jgi:hypothetical protein